MSDKPKVGSATINLVSIQRDASGKLAVVFAEGDTEWNACLTPSQVQTFKAFQRAVAAKLGLWVRSSTQDHHRARACLKLWQDEIGDAFDRGASG